MRPKSNPGGPLRARLLWCGLRRHGWEQLRALGQGACLLGAASMFAVSKNSQVLFCRLHVC